MPTKQDREAFKGCAILVFVLIIGSMVLLSLKKSNGFRVGTIVKCSTNGFFFHTHEGVLKPLNDSGSYVWEFSVSDNDVWKRIELASESGNKVKVVYEHKYFTLPWSGETHFFATDVAVIGSQ